MLAWPHLSPHLSRPPANQFAMMVEKLKQKSEAAPPCLPSSRSPSSRSPTLPAELAPPLTARNTLSPARSTSIAPLPPLGPPYTARAQSSAIPVIPFHNQATHLVRREAIEATTLPGLGSAHWDVPETTHIPPLPPICLPRSSRIVRAPPPKNLAPW